MIDFASSPRHHHPDRPVVVFIWSGLGVVRGKSLTGVSVRMSDPRNVAHNKKVKQEKEHHQPASADAKPKKGRARKTAVVGDQGDAAGSSPTPTAVTKVEQVPGELEKSMLFINAAYAGTLTNYNLQGGRVEGVIGTYVEFFNSSAAGSATFVLNGPTVEGGNGASVFFGDDASADHATITNQGAALQGAFGGQIAFAGRANAAFATIVNDGASGNSPVGGAYMESP